SRVDHVSPMDELLQIAQVDVEMRARYVGDQLGARRIGGVVKVAPAGFARFEDLAMLGIWESGLMVVEVPGQRRCRLEAIVQNSVLVAVQQVLAWPALACPIAATMVFELERRVE